jgi:Tol biopolymer transport system component
MSPNGWKTYQDFFLKIEPAGVGVYRVEARAPSGGEGEATFVLPFDEKDLEIFLLKIGRPRRLGNRGLIQEPAQPVLDFGNKLFDAVFKENVRDVFVRARNEAEIKDYGLRLRLRLTGAPELADLPWEYLYDNRDFLALSTTTPLIRYVDLPNPPRPLAIDLPLRILVMVSSPNDLPGLDVDKEKSKIQEALSSLIEDHKLELVFSQDATLQTLQRTLRQARSQGHPYHIWHFIGHGVFDPVSQTGQLAFCGVGGLLSPVDGFQLGTLIGDYPEIRLVLLNACEGARNSLQDPFAGVATALVERGIPAVIGMQFEISDEAAIVFSEGFYTALVDGLPVDAALTESRRSIFFMPNWIEWATPILFMRSQDGVLFNIKGLPSREKAEILVDQRTETERLAKEQVEAEQLVAQKAEQERLAKEMVEAERKDLEETERREYKRANAELAEPQRQSEKEKAERLTSQPFESELAASELTGQTRTVDKTSDVQPAPSVRKLVDLSHGWAIWGVGLILVVGLIAGFIATRLRSSSGIIGPIATETATFTRSPTQAIPVTGPTFQLTASTLIETRITETQFLSTLEPTEIAVQFTEDTGPIVFVSTNDDSHEIFVMNADGSEPTRLTSNSDEDLNPVWSPDGTRIAFESDRDGNWEIYLMNADGSELTRLTDNLADDRVPAWSPDGTRIAFASNRNKNFEIYVMNADGSEQTRLTNNPLTDFHPSWSPDGKQIVLESQADSSREIYVMNADGSEPARLTDNSVRDWYPTWSPDGTRIAFSSELGGNWEIYVMNLDGSSQTRLTDNPADDWFPSWSHDSNRIVFSTNRDGNWEIYEMNADGSEQTRITDNSVDDIQPDW